ncbi:Urease accessory protein UreD [Indibacter alkaliphilus LW1]|uniref:Urease accessory protein UreD n=1 Tax=Indibacter alkaliphilus (strain CCUG 57479 / KCTC 22604 / LW1) TaxID=1189612 RepID=S2DP34_INDAL|nr:urease accessory protein UreD [Indibacter alkaliphilus]EOZ91548.1 Urease accessory protein UreD [Indibacter alkaliphilus LW1]
MLKSRMALEAFEENGRTHLGESYHNAPYKMVHYGDKKLHQHLEMIMMSASPGMMEGDELEIDIKVKANAHLRLYTQSFNKIHPMKEKGALQLTKVRMEEHSMLHFIPHPVTPYEGSIFKTVNELEIPKSACLIWGDIIASGRVTKGESFQFKSLHSVTKLKVDGSLVLYDNQLLQPSDIPIQSLLHYEGFTHQATLIYTSPFGDQLKEELDEILAGQYQEITFGFTSCGPNSVMLRALGNDGELLYEWMTAMGRLCWEYTLHKKEEEKIQKDLNSPAEIQQPKLEKTPIELQSGKQSKNTETRARHAGKTKSKKKKSVLSA